MRGHRNHHLLALAVALAAAAPFSAQAQELPFGDVADDGADGDLTGAGSAARAAPRMSVTPYIEFNQVLLAELSPGSDTLTYSALAAGIDATIAGRNNQGAVSVRYERRFGWGRDTRDSDTLSGIARFQTAVVPRAVNFEAGALAARTSVENNGSTVNGFEYGDSATQIYSVYAGPSVATTMGDAAVTGHYRLGYTRVERPNVVAAVPGQTAIDVLTDSVAHNAALQVATRAGDPLPVGLAAGVMWNREDVSNLDQRVDDLHLRGGITVPLTDALSVVAGAGWERVEVSGRDAVRDPVTGLPVTDAAGRFVTDWSASRQIAYNADGLTWDAGVIWRPSRRTALEAHVGRRYGSETYYGSFVYAPSARTAISISAYDSITGFGGGMTRALAALPTQFDAVRNPLNGDLVGCVQPQGAVNQGSNPCLTGAFGAVKSAVFRGRGVSASLGLSGSRLSYGIAGGFDRRNFLAPPGTVLGITNQTVDENYWLAAYVNGKIDRASSFGANVWSNWYQSADAIAGDSSSIGATASYFRSITSRLGATAAVGVQGTYRDVLDDYWTAQAMAGVRYSF